MAPQIKFGRAEILFTVAVGMLIAMTVGAVFYDRQADAALVTAATGLLGLPVFLSAAKKEEDS